MFVSLIAPTNNNNQNNNNSQFQNFGENNNVRSKSPSMPDVLMANQSNLTGNEPLGFFKNMMQRPTPTQQQQQSRMATNHLTVTSSIQQQQQQQPAVVASLSQRSESVTSQNNNNTSEFLQLSKASNLGRSHSLVDEARELLSASRRTFP